MAAPQKCAVLVPVASSIEPETGECLQRLAARGYAVRTLRGCAQVDFARAVLATAALDDGFEEVMWIDSDVVFDAGAVDRLRGHGLPLAVGIYPRKGAPHFACTFAAPGTVVFGEGGGLVEVKYAGMGFMHVRRGVFERMERELKLPRCGGAYDPAKPVVPYFLPAVVPADGGRWEYLSEDASFCHRARRLGVKVVADTTIRLGHVGRYRYDWDDTTARPSYSTINVVVADGKGGG
jgi:hypothetical protein